LPTLSNLNATEAQPVAVATDAGKVYFSFESGDTT
jgi:hypothetical protein